MTPSPAQIDAMREWCMERAERSTRMRVDDIRSLWSDATRRELRKAINNHYPGGVEQFLTDNANGMSPELVVDAVRGDVSPAELDLQEEVKFCGHNLTMLPGRHRFTTDSTPPQQKRIREDDNTDD